MTDARGAGTGTAEREGASADRHVCIHGHFYQPPRENPWLETIERQDSAYPYHDWNERVDAECYAPNGASRVLDGRGRIVRIVKNYAEISFNVGPTLLAWLEALAPATYEAILGADEESRERFGGHGSALAQVYNHMILPLANARDRRTQVLWGVRDFEHRFGREPEGMWLPETAADVPTLEALAEAGIRFTVLAPHQAGRIRPREEAEAGGGPPGEGDEVAGDRGDASDGGDAGDGPEGEESGEPEPAWRDVSGGRVDPTRAYLQELPSGREMVLFFYDGPASRAVAFEKLLDDGARFAGRLLGLFSEQRDWPELVHIATDGETYGHHHAHGEMALSWALERFDERDDVRLTNYGEYLAAHPPDHEVEIVEETSWSCAHGVERWRSDCGCSTGGEPGWNQAWREPLREALDWLRDRVAPLYESAAEELFRDPWAARDDYIDVILDRDPENVDRFLERHAGRMPAPEERVRALELLELQRHAMLMYTSCGWFFTDLAGIETVQVIEYAGRVVQLAEGLFEEDIEGPFLERLAEARSNVPEQGTGRDIYERRVRPQMVDLEKVCAHHALSSLFGLAGERGDASADGDPPRVRLYCYRLEEEDAELHEVGRARLLLGNVRVASRITGEAARFALAALHFGDHNVQAGVRRYGDEETFEALGDALLPPFERADLTALLRALDHQFGEHTYSLSSLFRDEQRRIVGRILESTLEEVEGIYRQVYERHVPLMRFVAELGVPQPGALEMAGEFVLNVSLRRLLGEEDPDLEQVEALLEDAREEGVELDAPGLAFALQGALERVAAAAVEAPSDPGRLERFEHAVDLALAAPFVVNLWNVQNVFWGMLQEVLPETWERAEAGDEDAVRWLERVTALGRKLSVAVPA